ncbi:hypothetical protein Peur_042321 [Populus x canadensis]|uniref:Uncharacterized protein n=2 Tax=Populus deltoides TaxID=3696 RepID=A0A8T2Y5M4_POPDE|nr:hypothetical protein H0E87_015630 [Populus deltoides]
MEELSVQNDTATMDKAAAVVLDIASLAQPLDRSSGSPKMTRALSRKWSYRAERWTGTEDEDVDEPAKKLPIKGSSQLEPLKQPLVINKALGPSLTIPSGPNLLDPVDGWNKRFNRLMAINPRKILFMFATMSSMGTLILIYFTLAINRST